MSSVVHCSQNTIVLIYVDIMLFPYLLFLLTYFQKILMYFITYSCFRMNVSITITCLTNGLPSFCLTCFTYLIFRNNIRDLRGYLPKSSRTIILLLCLTPNIFLKKLCELFRSHCYPACYHFDQHGLAVKFTIFIRATGIRFPSASCDLYIPKYL